MRLMHADGIPGYEWNLRPRDHTDRLVVPNFVASTVSIDGSVQAIVELHNWPRLSLITIGVDLNLTLGILGMGPLDTAADTTADTAADLVIAFSFSGQSVLVKGLKSNDSALGAIYQARCRIDISF